MMQCGKQNLNVNNLNYWATYVLLYVLDDKSLITANDPIKGSFGSWDWKNMGKKKM